MDYLTSDQIRWNSSNLFLLVHIKFFKKSNYSGSPCCLCRTIIHCESDRHATDVKLAPILCAGIRLFHIIQQMCVKPPPLRPGLHQHDVPVI
jgi:hypothetical protein